MNKFNYNWNLKDGYPSKNGMKVFSCFASGGGSSMGYKMSGFDVIGFNEIDERVAKAYVENHNPKHCFIEPIQDFKDRTEFPPELYELDILDGSPPCSSFSMLGNREKDWGKNKKFREGQSEQVLDTLFFDFIELADKLKPKVVIAENVKGMVKGKAKDYLRRVLEEFDNIGYDVRHWVLDGSTMGLPQKRERLFVVAVKKEISERLPSSGFSLFDAFPVLDMNFKEKEIPFAEVKTDSEPSPISPNMLKYWKERKEGDKGYSDILERLENRSSYFSHSFIFDDKVLGTLTPRNGFVLYDEPRHLNDKEIIKASSFPSDYNFLENKVPYLCGMSVPPVMMANVASRVYEYILKPYSDLKNGLF